MRVVSLLPAATEIVAALGGLELLVGVSHECDHPPSVRRLPRVTAGVIDAAQPAAAIDAEVRRQAAPRPGPRIVTGVEVMAQILHPTLFPSPDPSLTRRL